MEQEDVFPVIHRIFILANRHQHGSHTTKREEAFREMHGRLIHFLYQNRKTPIYQRDIEKTFSIRRSTVSVILHRMEEDGFIVRKSVLEDARLKQILLTEKAEALYEHIERRCQEFEAVLTAGISEEDLLICMKALKMMCQNLETFEKEGGNDL